jgi:hypothetical protein
MYILKFYLIRFCTYVCNLRTKRLKTRHLLLKSGSGLPDFFDTIYPNGEKMYQNDYKICQMAQNIPNGSKIDKMSIKFTNNFRCTPLRNVSKLAFLVWKCTVWQRWSWYCVSCNPIFGTLFWFRQGLPHLHHLLRVGHRDSHADNLWSQVGSVPSRGSIL